MKVSPKISILQNDITSLEVDAIVNAANSRLAGGGGVDGAIHRVAGPQLPAACKELGGCKTGDAKLTPGFNIPSRFIIHTVGPIWRGGRNHEAELLKSCYISSLNLAIENKIKTIAFPNISTGIYGFPKKQAAEIAITAVNDFLNKNQKLNNVYFVCFDNENYQIYKELLNSV